MRGRTRVHMRIGALPTDRDCREWTLVLYHMTRPGPEYIQREEALRGPRCRGTLHGPHDCKVWQWGRCRMGEEAKVSATQRLMPSDAPHRCARPTTRIPLAVPDKTATDKLSLLVGTTGNSKIFISNCYPHVQHGGPKATKEGKGMCSNTLVSGQR